MILIAKPPPTGHGWILTCCSEIRVTPDRSNLRRRFGGYVFALAVGLLVAFFSYRWITNPLPRAERVEQENVVLASRQLLTATVGASILEIVDPVSPSRKIGKSYIYRERSMWEVSGYYRRDESDLWHPYLMILNSDLDLVGIKISDDILVERAATDPKMTIL